MSAAGTRVEARACPDGLPWLFVEMNLREGDMVCVCALLW
jgi:hypothetical protein